MNAFKRTVFGQGKAQLCTADSKMTGSDYPDIYFLETEIP